jgi:hypothetical protein
MGTIPQARKNADDPPADTRDLLDAARACPDYRDLVIEMLAESEAELREHVDRLLDIIARLAYDNFVLRWVVEREMVARIYAEGALDRERRRRRATQQQAAA